MTFYLFDDLRSVQYYFISDHCPVIAAIVYFRHGAFFSFIYLSLCIIYLLTLFTCWWS